MFVLLTIFFSSMILALLLTPVIGWFARRFSLVDLPGKRKVHAHAVPRLGGVSIVVSCLIPFVCSVTFCGVVRASCMVGPSLQWLLAGAGIVFLTGLYDDLWRLPPSIKFAAQLASAFFACQAGLTYEQIELPWGTVVSLGWFSVPATVFWFLVVINAINLIDGLDGLAAGIVLFVSLTLLALPVSRGNYMVAAGLAALAGSCMGFLRYNFNPASIFMGDGGSYFLGYMLAALSILGALKSQATVAIAIPVIALGLPLMDTMIAPIRRFLVGKDMFQPDKSHIHHKLLAMGLTQRKAVLLMYGAAIALGIFALLLVHSRDVSAAGILLLLGIAVIFGFRKIGYLEYVTADKILGYLHDVTDVVGISKGRRTFLNTQMEIGQSKGLDDLWEGITDACDLLKIDEARMYLNGIHRLDATKKTVVWCASGISTEFSEHQQSVFAIDLPLLDAKHNYGVLYLKKDLRRDPMNPYTLRRIEHLRRTIVTKLSQFEDNGRQGGAFPGC